METRIQVEIDELIKDLRKLNSAAVHPEVDIIWIHPISLGYIWAFFAAPFNILINVMVFWF